MIRKEILEEAISLTIEDRQDTHGPAYINHRRIADLWTAYLEHPISPEQVAICLGLMKVARSMHSSIRDHYIDGAAYFAIAGEMAEIAENQAKW
jgi:hypothetical protein